MAGDLFGATHVVPQISQQFRVDLQNTARKPTCVGNVVSDKLCSDCALRLVSVSQTLFFIRKLGTDAQCLPPRAFVDQGHNILIPQKLVYESPVKSV